MDENAGSTTDKRNWRERLGIGKNVGATELPKLADQIKPPSASPAPKPGVAKLAPHVAAKPAPMAPRAPAKPITQAQPATVAKVAPAPVSRPSAQRPMPSDALAAKLKDQRDAAEKLAMQRVAAAKQRAEAAVQQPAAGAPPKFSFADSANARDAAPLAKPLAPQPPAAGLRPQPQPNYAPMSRPPQQAPVQPPRPQLGGQPSYGQSYAPPPTYPNQPGYQPATQGYANPYSQPQPAAYRPIDPSTGYAPLGYGGQPRQPYGPQSGPATAPPTFRPQQRMPLPQRGPQLPLGPANSGRSRDDDIFEEAPTPRTGRRATANEYQKAYRDEMAYEDDAPRSRMLGTILGLILLGLLVAVGAIYGYPYLMKGKLSSNATGGTPVVAAPATTTKAPAAAATSTPAAQSAKKQIYDRIEGDHEVPGGTLKSTEEAPLLPQGNAASPPAASGSGTSATPLPLPPPPGTNGQQGALAPDGKADIANITPAAEQNSAANSSQSGSSTQVAMANPIPAPDVPRPLAAPSAAAVTDQPPAPSGAPAVPGTKPSPTDTAITDTEPPKPAAKPLKKADALKKLVLGKTAKPPKELGVKPLVLVPPARTAAVPEAPLVSPSTPTTSGLNSLYGDAPITAAPAKPAPQQVATLAKPAPTPLSPATPVAIGSGYLVQLSSFSTKAEAAAEYQRLGAKHGAIVTRYTPVILQSQVAGSSRYVLNLGPIVSNDIASSVCSSLITAGERDCVVHRQ